MTLGAGGAVRWSQSVQAPPALHQAVPGSDIMGPGSGFPVFSKKPEVSKDSRKNMRVSFSRVHGLSV